MSIKEKYEEILTLMVSVDTLVNSISSGQIPYFFNELRINSQFISAEAAYLRLVSWLYIHLFEDSSSDNIIFITDRFESHGISPENYNEFRKQIHSSRTILQHSYDISKSTDLEKLREHEYWLMNRVNKTDQLNEEDWTVCCMSLMNDFILIIESIRSILKNIQSNSEFLQIIIQDWINYLSKSISYYNFELILNKVLHILDLNFVPVDSLLRRNIEKWRSELRNYSAANVEETLQRIIERDVLLSLKALNIPIPITGSDIIEHFNIQPGRKVRVLLEKATEIFIENPCSRENLLTRLESYQ